MSNTVLCPNPERCGVWSHQEGSEALEQCRRFSQEWVERNMTRDIPNVKPPVSVASKDYDKMTKEDKTLIAEHFFDDYREELINDKDWSPRADAARYGDDEARTELLTDNFHAVRSSVALYGNEEHRWALKDDEEPQVRAMVAKTTLDPNLIRELSTDKNSSVRQACAQQGVEDVNDELVSDKDANVRTSVAIKGSDKQRRQLIDDPVTKVRIALAEYGGNDIREELLKNENENSEVLEAIAWNGTDKQRAFLINKYPHHKNIVSAISRHPINSPIGEEAKQKALVIWKKNERKDKIRKFFSNLFTVNASKERK